MIISVIDDPKERYFAYIQERENIYQKKVAGETFPWTDDTILQTFRFCDIYRERDKTSRHYQKTVREHYGDDPLVLPATVLYRWFNRISTCDAIFNAPYRDQNRSAFEQAIYRDDLNVLLECIDAIPPPHVTGAFIITGAPGYSKSHGVIEYFKVWMENHDWVTKWQEWKADPPLLIEMNNWLKSSGLGSFLTAQLVADLKYVPCFLETSADWWSFVAPGPGSMRGLNIVLGRPMFQAWNNQNWLDEIQKLNEEENIRFAGKLPQFHCQDTQNHCCEYSKYSKVMFELGRPRQVYRYQ
jgi:hypothetical protein